VGDGTFANVFDPVQVWPGTTWLTIAAGTDSTFAIRSDGTLWSWGNNASGQLGISPITQVHGGAVWLPPPL
jgi:alpha-tubulin suppressor-like RCC1 family protein